MSDWITQSYNGMQYIVLLPQDYNPSQSYSTTLYLHQLDNGSFGPGGLEPQINPWFNTPNNQSIVVAPLLDQLSDPWGQTINFGGYGTADTAGENNAIGALKQVMSQYSVDPSRVYVTGNSMGGVGTWDMLIKYNAYTGTEGRIFAAGMPIAGADFGQDSSQAANLLQNVPIWAFHGAQDTQVPLSWDRTLAGDLAGSSTFHYTEDPSGGHDVWDETYGQGYGPGTPLGWLDSQGTGGNTPAPAPQPSPAPPAAAAQVSSGASADGTVVTPGSGGFITDTHGTIFTITDGDQLAADGYVDQTTHNVEQLVYLDSSVWQEAYDGRWWAESGQPTPYGNGSTVSPLPESQSQPVPATPVASSPPQPAPSPADGSSGADSLTINAAGYAVQGVMPQFIASVDGTQVGGVNTVTATEYDGTQDGGNQAFTFSGNWGSGPHTVGVDYINNNSPGGDDANIFINSIQLDGHATTEYTQSGSVSAGLLYQDGTVNFSGITGNA